jgi:SAM-dependent methyltransferase
MLTRRAKLLSFINPYVNKGAEIGALDKPIVTPDMGFIKYIDYTTTEELKTICTNRNPEKMVEVDYVWGDSSLDSILQRDLPLDYVIASHVVEHVPDFLGWLQEVYKILKPGGFLSLALPAKTQCFDYYRNETVTSDVIDSYIRNARKPSPKAIFDHLSLAVTNDNKLSWGGKPNENKLKRTNSLKHAFEVAKEAYEQDVYKDTHCWTFTPQSLSNLLKDLIEMDLFGFKVAAYYAITRSEFFITLESVELVDNPKIKSEQFASLKLIK